MTNKEAVKNRIEYLENALVEHDKPIPNWPSGKSTVDRNIRRHYMVQELNALKDSLEDNTDA